MSTRSPFAPFTHIIPKTKATNTITNNVGAIELPVLFKSIKDNKGVNPAERLAAIEYSTDKTVQRRLMGNISANMTGTVA